VKTKALEERAAKTKDVEARLQSTAREHNRPREKALRGPKIEKSAR